MARPVKEGLEYFSFDVDFFDDEKIQAIAGEFGIKGEIITIRLLCAVYRQGYFAVWDELLKMKLMRQVPGASADMLEQVVRRLVKWGFFDQNLFNSDKVLTSYGIQKRYFSVVVRRKSVNVCKNYLLDGVSAYINPQRKGKEKEKTIQKENFEDERPPAVEDFLQLRQSVYQQLPEETRDKFARLGVVGPMIRNTNTSRRPFVDVVEVLMDVKNDDVWRMTQMQTLGIEEEQFRLLLQDFIRLYIGDASRNYDESGFKGHFHNWARKRNL